MAQLTTILVSKGLYYGESSQYDILTGGWENST